ncbi:hypothetical protein AMS68_003798 [Peltaster fructicola]|uniref:Uncharacterized protein n=1 Tax=Peltaster fructicola TaxID=286661 RepID=A0A6H0XUD7_9PEZI|nr:hypothetical protein AMS68_003798 [Peltaster fructicola]
MPAPQTPFQPYATQHEDPSGKGDARPTARQIVRDAGPASQLNDKVILITGCSGGLGEETARALYETGAQLFLTARDMGKMETVIDDIVSKAGIKDAPRPQAIQMSLDSLKSIKHAVEDLQRQTKQLHMLIENAGVMCCPSEQTEDGFERHFGTNHLGHFYLFKLLQPLLLQTAATSMTSSRVIVVSSAGHRRTEVVMDDLDWQKREYDPLTAYCQSKTANIWMANELDRRFGSRGLHAVSVHPGMIWTDISRHMTPAQIEALGVHTAAVRKIEKSSEQGAATTVWAAVSPHFERHGGVYLGDCGECGPGNTPVAAAYAPHAYDEEKEKALWELSCKMVGLPGDDE